MEKSKIDEKVQLEFFQIRPHTTSPCESTLEYVSKYLNGIEKCWTTFKILSLLCSFAIKMSSEHWGNAFFARISFGEEGNNLHISPISCEACHKNIFEMGTLNG